MEYFQKNLQSPIREDNLYVVKYEIGESSIDVHFFQQLEANRFYQEMMQDQQNQQTSQKSQEKPSLNLLVKA